MAPLLVQQPAALAFFQEQLLPPVIQRWASATSRLRLWSSGCQAGDEASTLALLVRSLLPASWDEPAITLFATDADPVAVSRARRYRYPAHLLSHLPEAALSWLEADPSDYQLHPRLRQQLLFGSHALFSQVPFPHLHLILLHDSLADVTAAQQQFLFNRLAYALTPGGYLWLAAPAARDPDPAYYRPVGSAWPLYQRTAAAVPVRALGWSKAERSWVASSFTQTSAREDEEGREASLEEVRAALEDREMAYQEANQRLQELEQAYRDLERLQRLKEDFLALISHEMRTPLTVLLATAQLLQRSLAPARPGETAERVLVFEQRLTQGLETMAHEAQHLSRLLDELLDAARLQSEMFSLSPHAMNLVPLVQEIIRQHELVSARPIRFVTAYETMWGIWDAARLEQVVRNLLSNALKYSEPPTEIVLTLRHRFVAGQAQEALLSVQDQGRGISEEDLPQVFERFYRAERFVGDLQGRESLGLGLYISAEIVKRHAGRMWAESRLGTGSTFFVALPLRMPADRFPSGAAAGMTRQHASGERESSSFT